jgi:hypothetical protein
LKSNIFEGFVKKPVDWGTLSEKVTSFGHVIECSKLTLVEIKAKLSDQKMAGFYTEY